MAALRTRKAHPRRRGASAAPRDEEVDLGILPDLIGFMLRRAQIAVFQEIFKLFSQVSIRPAQFSVLAVIERNPGLTQSKVAAALGIKRTNFVAVLDSLEQRGLARRRPAADDRRSHALHLTVKGRAVMRRLKQMVDLEEKRLVARIGERGRIELLDLLQRLTEARRAATERTRRAGALRRVKPPRTVP